MIVIDSFDQRSPEWYNLHSIPTASQFSRILSPKGKISESREGYMKELVEKRITGVSEDGYVSWDMRRGIELEPESISYYELVNGIEIMSVAFIYKDESENVGCSPDGVNFEIRKGLETKAPSFWTHHAYLKKNRLPNEYFCQVQGSLWICQDGIDTFDFQSYYPGLKSLQLTIEPDLNYHRLLDEAIPEFLYDLAILTRKTKEIIGG